MAAILKKGEMNMAFIKSLPSYVIGDRVVTTQVHESFSGYFEIGTKVTITGIGDRGYDIRDDEGNEVTECGWKL